jgi:hypothetical protein
MEQMMQKLSVDGIFSRILPQLITENPDVVQKVRAIINFKLTGQNIQEWTVDLLDNPGIRSGLANDARCQVTVDRQVFESLLRQNKIMPWLDAYKNKQIKVKGYLPTILKIERLIYKRIKN